MGGTYSGRERRCLNSTSFFYWDATIARKDKNSERLRTLSLYFRGGQEVALYLIPDLYKQFKDMPIRLLGHLTEFNLENPNAYTWKTFQNMKERVENVFGSSFQLNISCSSAEYFPQTNECRVIEWLERLFLVCPCPWSVHWTRFRAVLQLQWNTFKYLRCLNGEVMSKRGAPAIASQSVSRWVRFRV